MKTSERRRIVWDYLSAHPGQTSVQVARMALGRSASVISAAGGSHTMLVRMERDGLVRREMAFNPQQGRQTATWFAVPGAFPASDG